jgi:hypothetical protein
MENIIDFLYSSKDPLLGLLFATMYFFSMKYEIVEKAHRRFDRFWSPNPYVLIFLYTFLFWLYAIVRAADVVGDWWDARAGRQRKGSYR